MNSIQGIGAWAEVLLIRPPLHTGEGGQNQQEVKEALLLRRATTPDAKIAVMRAGTIPYFSGRPGVDMLGKNDRHVAHALVTATGAVDFREFRPGHMKWDFAHSIGGQQPDVILHLRQRVELARPFLQQYQEVLLEGRCAHVRRPSPHVMWDRLSLPGCGEHETDDEARQGPSSNLASGLLQGVTEGS
jgi:hypothetical protein